MPDITMCANKSCPKLRSCYRFMAIPDRLQSYAGYVPVKDYEQTTWVCDHFSKIRKEDRIRKDGEVRLEN